MKLLKKILIAALLAIIFFGAMKKYIPSMQAVYPKQCAFLIDEQFSSAYQAELQDYVSQKYQSCKDFNQILDDVSKKFAGIETMDAYICKTDHVCFSFDAVRPLFFLNDCIVCNNAQLVDPKNYHTNVIDALDKIQSEKVSDVQALIRFFNSIPKDVFEEFNMCWNSDEEIVLNPKNKKQETLLFSVQSVPNLDAIALFKQIQGQKKSNKKQIYDFRFNNQVIVK